MRIEEEEFIKLIKNETIKTLVDVGANIGNYTSFVKSELPDIKTYCIEPISSCFSKLENKFGSDEKVTLINTIISSKNETVSFNEAVGKESHSSIVNRDWLYRKPEYKITKREIEATTLDNLIDENIDILKIDTEGYELAVLQGCEKLLKENKIRYIQFEYGGCFKDNNITLNDVIDYLKKYDYKVYSLTNGKLLEIKNYKDDYQWINFFAKK